MKWYEENYYKLKDTLEYTPEVKEHRGFHRSDIEEWFNQSQHIMSDDDLIDLIDNVLDFHTEDYVSDNYSKDFEESEHCNKYEKDYEGFVIDYDLWSDVFLDYSNIVLSN